MLMYYNDNIFEHYKGERRVMKINRERLFWVMGLIVVIAGLIVGTLMLTHLKPNDGAAQATIVKLNTSTLGGEHTFSLAMLRTDQHWGGLIMITNKGVRAAYGVMWKSSKGFLLLPVGVVYGAGKDGARLEHLSFWTIFNMKFGKFVETFMGSYNTPIIRDKNVFSNASYKNVLVYDLGTFRLGARMDFSASKPGDKWKRAFGIGPALEVYKGPFCLQLAGTVNKPYTVRLEWGVNF
jgi:hypothetical protein